MAETSVRTGRLQVLAVSIVYLSGFLQGLTLVSFPASSVLLKQMHGITDAEYGSIFLPQVVLTILGALGGGALANRLGLKNLLWIALLANAVSQLLLAGSIVMNPALAFTSILLGTASLGLGFGLSGAPLNSYPSVFFPLRSDTALVALHTALGLGLAVGPLFASMFIAADMWIGFPLSLLAACSVLTLMAAGAPFPRIQATLDSPDAESMDRNGPVKSVTFWVFMLLVVLYAFAEGTFYNWAVIYLQETKQLPMATAGLALSIFWVAMVAGRLTVSIAVLRIPAEYIWLMLPVLMIVAFLLLPYADTPVLGIGLFALAGLACSAFFPLSVGLVSKRFEYDVAWVSSMMIAALMIGVGMGSFLIGALRESLPLEQLYRFSSIYPLLVFMLVVWLLRSFRIHATPAPAVQTDC